MRSKMVGLSVTQLLRNLEFVDHYDQRTATRELMYWVVDRLDAGAVESVNELFMRIDITRFSPRFLVALIRCTLHKGVSVWDTTFKDIRLNLKERGCDVPKLFTGIKYSLCS